MQDLRARVNGEERWVIPAIQKCRAVDLGLGEITITIIQTNPAGETGFAPLATTGAEGATAPETLRQKDRRGMKLWKAATA